MEMKFKYNVGDMIIKNKGTAIYSFKGIHKGIAKEGDIFKISCRGISITGKLPIYSVEGGSDANRPNWHSMEQEFDLLFDKKTSWRKLLKGDENN